MKHDDALPALPIGEAEVLWHEPDPVMPERPGKIIDASHAFMDAAPLGTRLYSAEQMRAYARAALAARAEPSADERRLRRLLCIARHGRSAYTDDGEASDCSGHPSIDYLRDSLDEIEAKWRLRASATLTAPEPSEAEVAAAMASLYRAMEPAAWPSEDEVTDALRAAAAARGK